MNKTKGQYTLEEQDEMLKEIDRILGKLTSEYTVNFFRLDMYGHDFFDAVENLKVDLADARQTLYQMKESEKL